jgi:hypothetical protein
LRGRKVLPSHLNIEAIHLDLEVDSSRGVLCLSNELPALNVQTDEQPPEDADERADEPGNEKSEIRHTGGRSGRLGQVVDTNR